MNPPAMTPSIEPSASAVRPASPASRSALYLVATDVTGRASLLAGPYGTLSDAVAAAPTAAGHLARTPALAAFGHVTVAEGAPDRATLFGAV